MKSPSGTSANRGEMSRTRICLKTKKGRRFPLLEKSVCSRDMQNKACTWLFWQEKEGLDYPFPPHESGHLRWACWRHICFSTNRAKASPWPSLLRHSLRDRKAAAVRRTQSSASPAHLSVWDVSMGIGCALLGSVPFRGHQQLWSVLQEPHLGSLAYWFWSGHLGIDRIKIAYRSLCTSCYTGCMQE